MASAEKKREVIHTKIWREEPEPDNPFAAKKCFCAGYDVYGDLLGKASWIEYLYLLFKLEKPTPEQAKLLETIAVAIANPGIRDHSVRAAMNAGVGAASALMAALAVGAGQYGGAREIYLLLKIWQDCGMDLNAWKIAINDPPKSGLPDCWPETKHFIGFDPYASRISTPQKQIFEQLLSFSNTQSIRWLKQNQNELEDFASCSFSLTSIIAAALFDLGFNHKQGEMLYLLLRLPGAAAHGLEQKNTDWKNFPFYINGLEILDDPHAKEK